MDMRASVLSSILSCLILLELFDVYDTVLLLRDAVAKPKFDYFKKRYHKSYRTEAEENQAYLNFVNNWNNMEKLNEKHALENVVHMINNLADMSPVYFNQHYAVNLTPYDNEVAESIDAKILRESKQNRDHVFLYDLDNAEELYKKYLKKYRRPKMGKMAHSLRYLKFVQTLAQINKHNFQNNDNMTYDDHADKLKEPKENTMD